MTKVTYLTTSQAAEQWGVSARRVRQYLEAGRIPGAVCYSGHLWLVPVDAVKPSVDPRLGRRKCG